jgi:hypothetical protein
LQRLVSIKVNGEPVLMQTRRSQKLGSVKVKVGKEAVVDPAFGVFRGEIVAMRRVGELPVALPDEGSFVRLRLRFPAVINASCQPLISYGEAAGGVLLSSAQISDKEVQFRLTGSVNASASEVLSLSVGRLHEIAARMEVDHASRPAALYIWLDGSLAWVRELVGTSPATRTITVGKNIVDAPDCAAAFGGEIVSVQENSTTRDPLEAGGDSLRVRLQFPQKPAAGREPIVVTGCTGQGDILMVEYVDNQTIRFALDHWGSPLRFSSPIKIDYAKNHELEITMSSLDAVDDVSMTPGFHSGRLRLKMNGVLVWDESAEFYFTEPGELSIGRNNIGGTTCAPAFGGDILAADRIRRE